MAEALHLDDDEDAEGFPDESVDVFSKVPKMSDGHSSSDEDAAIPHSTTFDDTDLAEITEMAKADMDEGSNILLTTTCLSSASLDDTIAQAIGMMSHRDV